MNNGIPFADLIKNFKGFLKRNINTFFLIRLDELGQGAPIAIFED